MKQENSFPNGIKKKTNLEFACNERVAWNCNGSEKKSTYNQRKKRRESGVVLECDGNSDNFIYDTRQWVSNTFLWWRSLFKVRYWNNTYECEM